MGNPTLAVLLGAIVLLVTLAAVLLLQEAGSRDLELRIAAIAGGERREAAKSGRMPWLADVLRRIGGLLHERTRMYSEQDLAALAGIIGGSGMNPRQMLPLVLGAKFVVMVAVPTAALGYGVFAGLPGVQDMALLAAGTPVGVLAPEYVLRMLRRPYTEALARGASDALDLLVVCTEAGMGLEAAIDEVAREMRHSNRAMSAALGTLGNELKILPDRRQAFINFGNRSGVEGIRRMAAIISQALQYGTPLGQVLRAVAGELRRERMTRLEAKAVRLPALLVFPLIAFILPSLFIALMGGPMLKVMDTLHGASK